MFENTDYNIFSEFIKNYCGEGFMGINNQDHLMIRLNRLLDRSNQFFYVGDIPRLKLLYTSPQVRSIFGVEPENFDLSYNLINTHPSEIQRRSRARVNIIEKGQEFYMKKSGMAIVSANFMVKTSGTEYIPVLVQSYLFYSCSPVDTVYILQINTRIDWLSRTIRKGHYHWYAGADLNYFRYPDEELLHIGTDLSERELDILMNIRKGMTSKEIGKKLSLSHHTVNTHRRNILKKRGKTSIGEVIYELEGIGIM